MHLSGCNTEVESVQRMNVSVALRQTLDIDDKITGHEPNVSSFYNFVKMQKCLVRHVPRRSSEPYVVRALSRFSSAWSNSSSRSRTRSSKTTTGEIC